MKHKDNTTAGSSTKQPLSQTQKSKKADSVKEEHTAKSPVKSAEEHPIKEIIVPKDWSREAFPSSKKRSLFGRKPKKDTPTDENKSLTVELICKRSGLSEDDISMMFELGYENELGRLIGYDNLKVLKAQLHQNTEQEKIHGYRSSFAYRGNEFRSNSQSQAILAAYVHDRKFLVLRLLLSALCTLLLFFVDQPDLLIGTTFESFAFENRRLLDVLGLALLIPIFALSYKQIHTGLHSFFHFSATPYSFPALIAPFVALYGILVVILQGEMIRINFLIACVFLLMALCDVLRLSCEMRTLRLIATDVPKHVLTGASPKKKKLRHNNKIVKIVNDDLGKNIYDVRTTEQTVGFFRRFNAMGSAARPFTILIACMFAFSVFTGFVSAIYTDSVVKAFSLAMTVLTLSMPLTCFFAFFYPISRANRILSRKKCALIGEEAVQELESEKTVVFRDTLMYNAEKYTEIAVREGDDLRDDMRLSGALFRKLGGTLKPLGAGITSLHEDPQISIIHVQDYGVEALADGQRELLLGSAEYLRHAGVRVPRESTDSELRRTESVCLMYLAIDGVLKLSYEVKYETKPSFEQLIEDLADGNVEVAISSCDPNLNDLFLQKSRPEETEPVLVRKPNRFEEEKQLESADTPVVALEEETDVAFPLYAAKSIHSLRRFAWRMQLISSILGTIIVLLLMVFNPEAPLGIMPILGYQALWVIIFALSAHAELSESRFRFNR